LPRIRGLALEVNTNASMRREAYSMSLYVSIVLLSALMVSNDSNPPEKGELWLLEAGTTIGLVLEGPHRRSGVRGDEGHRFSTPMPDLPALTSRSRI